MNLIIVPEGCYESGLGGLLASTSGQSVAVMRENRPSCGRLPDR